MKRKDSRKHTENAGEMDVLDHLRELRGRLLVCLGTLALWLLAGLYFAPQLLKAFLGLGERYGYRYVYLSPEELLTEYFAVAFALSLVLTLPVLLWELWAFLRPALNREERGAVLAALLGSAVFAGLGVVFAYRVMIPFMLRFFLSLGEESGVAGAVSVRNYISLLLTLFLVFAAVFELPVASVLLTWFGVLTPEAMRRSRRAVIPLIFLLAAVITPPDVVSQVMTAVPLLGLYELSILLCSLLMRSRR